MTPIVRPADVADADAIQAIYAPIVETTVISFEDIAPDVPEIRRRIETISETYPYLVAEIAGRVVGYAYASSHRIRAAYRWSVDVSVYVDESARGQGVGKALYGDLLRRLAEAGFHAAFAGVALPNAGSVALHEAMGFRQVGVYREVGHKFGRWHDVGWWQRILNGGT